MLTLDITIVILAAMNWKKIILEIMDAGLTQVQIGEAIGKSQAWVSNLAKGHCRDVTYSDGVKLLDLHKSTTTQQAA